MCTNAINFPTALELGKTELDCVVFQAERTTGVPDVIRRNVGVHIYPETGLHLDHIPNKHVVGVSI